MSFSDIIKNSVIEEFSGELTFQRVILSILISFAVALFIVWIYKLTFRGAVFSGGFAMSLLLLSVITTAIIMTVTTNLALSLGMVGALSIVRFRTAVKDANDTVFMFWAVCSGIMSGAGLVFWAVFANVLMGILYLIASYVMLRFKAAPFLLTVRYQPDAAQEVKQALKMLPKTKIRAKSVTREYTELSASLKMNEKDFERIDSLRSLPGVIDASVIAYNE